MKTSRYLTVVCIAILAAGGASAQHYWDSNGSDSGAGANPLGNWGAAGSGGSAFWTTTADGTGTPGAWADWRHVVFSAGTDAQSATITVVGSPVAQSLTIEEGVYTFAGASGATLKFGDSPTFTVSNGLVGTEFAASLAIGSAKNNTCTWTLNSDVTFRGPISNNPVNKYGSATGILENTFTGNFINMYAGTLKIGAAGSLVDCNLGLNNDSVVLLGSDDAFAFTAAPKLVTWNSTANARLKSTDDNEPRALDVEFLIWSDATFEGAPLTFNERVRHSHNQSKTWYVNTPIRINGVVENSQGGSTVLTKRGSAAMVLANVFKSTLTIAEGDVRLDPGASGTGDSVLDGGSLVLGTDDGFAAGVQLTWKNTNSIIKTVDATARTLPCKFRFEGATDRIFDGPGDLTVSGNVYLYYSTPILTVNGTAKLSLTGGITHVANSGGNAGLIKAGTGLLVLGGESSFGASSSAAGITVNAGALRLNHATAIRGGLGATGGECVLRFGGGVVELTANSGDLTRALGTGIANVRFDAGGGGFSAHGGNRFVNFGGATGTVTWASGSFVPNGSPLIFGSQSANAQIAFQNSIDLNNAVREIRVNDNTNSTADGAVLAGALSSSSGAAGVNKTGDGMLFFEAANTFTGPTTVSAGSVGGNGSLAGGLTLNAGGGFAFDWDHHTDALDVAGAVDLGNAGTLVVVGTPSVSSRTVILTATGGITGTFDTVLGLKEKWTVDYSVPGEVALLPPLAGTVILIR